MSQETRMVCLGDSFTEGMTDVLRPDGHHLGWADRVAAALARQVEAGDGPGEPPRLLYANLAVRGKLLDQVVADQLPLALSYEPTIATFHAGPNDVLRRGTDLVDLRRRYDRAVARLAERSERVLLFTSIGRSGGDNRLGQYLASRFERFNADVHEVADRRGAGVVDLGAVSVLTDRRVWAPDRLHLDAGGHARVAAAVLEHLGVNDEVLLGGAAGWWREPLPTAPASSRLAVLASDLTWGRRHLVPWLGRRLRGTSSGDGRSAKDPVLRPVVVDL